MQGNTKNIILKGDINGHIAKYSEPNKQAQRY